MNLAEFKRTNGKTVLINLMLVQFVDVEENEVILHMNDNAIVITSESWYEFIRYVKFGAQAAGMRPNN